MAGRPTRQHISRFAQWDAPTAYGAGECSVKGASVLKHTEGDSRAVAETRNRATGARILLCADCLSYVEAYHWAAGQGLHIESETLLSALALVWRSELGYQMGPVNQWRGSQVQLRHLGHNFKVLVLSGHLKKIGTRYLLRDACPSCLRRGGCAAECMLHMGEDFAQRREAQLQ